MTSFSVARRTREIGLRMSRLVGLRASDPGTLSAATLALLTVVLLAGYVPAPRATRVDPMVALRIE